MKDNLIFSVITVTFNASRWLEQTIQSVISQSYPGIRHLIIDGGSTDGTIDILKKYESSLFYWISEPDKGLYDAMNKGLEVADGDYVWFMNAGDTFYSEDTVQKVVNTIDQPEMPDIIYGETRIVDAIGGGLGLRRLRAPEKLTWKSFRMGMLVCHQSFVVSKAIAPRYNLLFRFSSDYEWCIQCLLKARFIHNTHLVLSNFLTAGMTTENRKASLKERYQIMCNYYGKVSTSILHIWFAIRFYAAKWFHGSVE